MALIPGTRLGPYEITAQIGVGGMGEVYRATDTKLKRQVAIKVLPASVSADAERLARFQREAEVLASLNHPNIAIIHGLEQTGDVHALVMELVEGDDLSQRIARGAIPIDEALPIAKQIAEALEAAHEQGIIHRDLKPANIKVRADGTVKVLDFGLAKAMEPVGAMSPSNSMSPTITTPAMMTGVGMILGTAAYMSPEQARGKTVDKRADIWAFGAVLFEMLTGARAFEGEDMADTLAAVVRADPNWTLLPAGLPLGLVAYIRRCLYKDPKQRIPDIAAMRLALDGAFETAAPPAARWTRPAAWGLAMAVAVVASLVTGVGVWLSRPTPAFAELHVDVATPPTTSPESFALSPDGLRLAFVATSNRQPMLWLRSLEDGTTRLLAGTEGAVHPFWSPDSRSIAFLVGGASRRVDLSDGSVRSLLERGGRGSGGTWNRDGVIVYSPDLVSSLLRLSVDAPGKSASATQLVAAQRSHQAPYFLPDGRHFLYYANGTPEVSGLYVGSLDGTTPKRLAAADRGAVLAAGHLVFSRQGTLIAQPFDLTRLELTGDPFRVVVPEAGSQAAAVGGAYSASASATGVLAFRRIVPPREHLVWFDRSGAEVGRFDDTGVALNPELSPDGSRLAAGRTVAGKTEIWSLDLARGTWTPLTAGNGTVSFASAWSPDGRRIAFGRVVSENLDFYVKSASLTAPEEKVLSTPELKMLSQWSPDGRSLLYQGQRQDRLDTDIFALPLERNRTPSPLVQTKSTEAGARFSRDGKWIAYESDETGRFEIFAQRFPGPGERVQISTTGGAQAQWRPDGKELFYIGLDERLMAVPLRVSADGARLEPGQARALFPTRIPGGAVQAGGLRQQYVVGPDGQRFLMRTLADDAAAPITLILNWNPDAKK